MYLYITLWDNLSKYFLLYLILNCMCIGCVMLGAGSVTGLDIDPQVVYINQLFHLVAWCLCVCEQ